jgi:Fe-S-cluster containining protein
MRAHGLDRDLLERWLDLARRDDIDAALRAVHVSITDESATSRPVCTASGRCCDFQRTGHALFVTGLEVAWTLDRIPAERAISEGDVTAAIDAGDCPFLVADGSIRRCGVHPARPMGCRVYFCDPTRERFVQDLAERGARLVRELHDRFGVPYVYAEWRSLLGCFASAGVASVPTRPIGFASRDPFVPLTRGSASSGG